jgi:acyl-CoA thioesterase-1
MTSNNCMRRIFLLALVAALAGCSLRNVSCGLPPPPTADAPAQTPAAQGAAAAPRSADSAEAPTTKIAFLGDSITAGSGLLSSQAFPDRLQALFAAEGYHEIDAINGGVSGDTTAGGLRRVEQLLESGVKILVVELGGNDALRGLSVAQTHDNLAAIIQKARDRGVAVMVCGMEAPTNLGEDYREGFRAVFQRLRAEFPKDVVHIPFVLEGVAGRPELNQPDGIHPNQEGAKKIAELLYPKLRDLVDQLPSGGGGG